MQVDQQQREAGQPLLTIHDLLFLVRLADNDGAEEVMPVGGHVLTFMLGLVLFEKRRGEVGDEFDDLLGLPLVFALVVVDAVLGVA